MANALKTTSNLLGVYTNRFTGSKSSEVSTVNADIESVLHNLSMPPLLVVDMRLRITRFSTAAAELFKIRSGDIGQSLGSLEFSNQLPDLREPLLRVLESGESKVLITRIKNKEYRLTLSVNKNEQQTTSGATLFFSEVYQDEYTNSIQKNANTERLALISLLTLSVAVVVANSEGNILIFNNAAEALFGYAQEEVILHNVSLLTPEPIREQHPQFLTRYIEQETAHFIGQKRTLVGQHKNGTRIPIDMFLSEIALGQERHFMAVIYPSL